MEVIREIRNNYKQATFLIGNGANLYAGIMPSWKELLKAAADRQLEFDVNGLTNTEVYDLVVLNSNNGSKVKQRVCEKLQLEESYNLSVHKRIIEFARETDTPVLTTNFDEAFEKSVQAKLYHIDSGGFTRFYPWKSYYGFQQHKLPTDGFGIWKIHGDVKYADSIRLGLTDYMGSAQRARKLLLNGPGRLFNENTLDYWQGYQTWLHIWFNLPTIIFGFGFGSDEVFLRWLLIERKRYMNFIDKPMDVWYISPGEPLPTVHNLLHNLGVEFKIVSGYSEIYG
jgi:hypothetical protein